MTQTVKLPNGDTLNFPDDMPDDAIAKAIADNYPEYAPKGAAPAAAAPAATVPNPVAPDPVVAGGTGSGGSMLDAVSGWYGRAKQAILDTPVLAPGQEPGQPAPNAELMAGAKGGPDFTDLPVTPEYLRAMQAQWNAATPAQRRELAGRQDHMGVVARRMNAARPALAAEEAPDTLGILGNKGVQLDTTSAMDMLDPTAEARTRRLIRAGVRGDLAADEARVAAARDIPTGAEVGVRSSVSASDFDFATFKKFNEDPLWSNPAVRGAAKGYEGYKQGILGMNQAIGEAVGLDVSGQAAMAKESRGTTDAMGERGGYLQRQFEGTISSIAQQLPAMIGGAVTGSEGAVLASMFASTFGQEYSDSRAKGQAQGAALTRAGLFGAFEVIGEKAGLGERMGLLKEMAHGIDTPMLARWMANTLRSELPGEMLTTTGQFLIDKDSTIGMNQRAGWDDYLQQMADTVTQTIMQGAIMGAGTGGIKHVRRYVTGQTDRGAEFDANAAQRDALSSWNTNGLSPSSRAGGNPPGGSGWNGPAERREPTLGDIAAAGSVDDAIAAADAVVSAPVSTPAAPRTGLDPATVPSAADIDALEQAAGFTADHTPDEQQAAQDHLITERQARAQEAAGKRQGETSLADLPPGGEPAPALDPAGKSADDIADWHPFPPESRTLGVPRAQMPQIKAEHRGAMVNFLNARGIAHEQVTIDANDLKPTQREFSASKVDKAINYEGGNRSILISSDNYVLDGHHQWMAAAVKGEPVQAIRLNAPIKELVKTVHEFPSATVDTASAPAAGLGQGARIGQTALDANAQRIQRQEDAVRAAAESLEKRKSTGGQRARERLKQENPFLGFLASHGVKIDERSDTGGQKGRAGGIMVPGYGPLYRAGGKRLDELAQLAHEAGFLSDQDVNDSTDNGGTRKLADMIQRAAHAKEVIQPAAGLLDAVAPTADQHLIVEAQRLGLPIEGKTADQLYDAVRAAHDAEEGRRETSGATSIDEQDQVDQLAEQIPPQQLIDADIPLNLNDPRLAPDHELTEEEIDAIFGIQKASGPRADRGEAEGDATETASEGAAPVGQPGRDEGQDLLTSYSASDLAAREEEAAARAKRVQAERDKLEARQKKEQDAKEAKVRADATVDDFQLGQDANDQLSGKTGLFDAPSETESGKTATDAAVVTRGEDGAPVPVDPKAGLKKEIERARGKKGEQLDNATAPEHIAGVDDRELGQIVAEFKDAQAEMMQGEHPITNIFQPPKKKDIVRLADKARATGKLWNEDESKQYRDWLTEAKALTKKKKPVPAELTAKIEAFEKKYLPFAAKLKKEAAAIVEKWKEQTRAQHDDPAKRSANSQKVVLSFFDLSGEWSRPWEEAGYQVYRFDIQDDPVVGDVNNFSAEFFGDWFGDFDGMEVYAILAACPCTDFASSGNRHFVAKDADGRTVASVKLVHQTLKAIEYFKPAIWALENPVGRIEKLGGLPPWRLSFDPYHLGDDYTKKTLIWGRFNADLPVAPAEPTEGSKMWSQYGGKSMETKNARSETPEGFSYGFFLANNAIDHPALALHGKFDRLDRNLIQKALDAGVTADEIESAVEDHYYMELDDDAANNAIRDLIGEAKEEGRAPAEEEVDQIPLEFYATVTVPYRALGAAEPVDLAADKALANTRDEMQQLEDMLKCMGD
jgi:hypothetical protein